MNQILTIMDVIAAKLATIACLIVFLKYVVMRFKNNRVNIFFQKAHKPATVFLICFACVHGLASLRAFKEAPFMVYLLGAFLLIIVLCTGATHLFKKQSDEQHLKWHRILALGTFILFVAHLIFGFWAYFQL